MGHKINSIVTSAPTAATTALIFIAATFALNAKGEQKPTWEVGLGTGALSFPAYRGSDEQLGIVLPIPYVVYRGDWVKADREGIRSIFFDSERIHLNLSMNASIPVDSDRVDARYGMPDLTPTVEIGPSLNFTLWQSRNRQQKFELRLPARYAITAETNPEAIGWQLTPRLTLDLFSPAKLDGWNVGLLAGPIYSSKRQHDYFYSVDDRYATATRPAYEASGGYAGWQWLGSISKRFPHYWIGGFIRYDSLRDAVFADSPLVTSNHYTTGGIAVAWIIGESSQRIDDR